MPATFHQSLRWHSAYGCATPGSGWEWERKLHKLWNSAFPVEKLSQTSPGLMSGLKSKWKRDDFCIVYFQPNKCNDMLPWWFCAVESIYQFQQLADVKRKDFLAYSHCFTFKRAWQKLGRAPPADLQNLFIMYQRDFCAWSCFSF